MWELPHRPRPPAPTLSLEDPDTQARPARQAKVGSIDRRTLYSVMGVYHASAISPRRIVWLHGPVCRRPREPRRPCGGRCYGALFRDDRRGPQARDESIPVSARPVAGARGADCARLAGLERLVQIPGTGPGTG